MKKAKEVLSDRERAKQAEYGYAHQAGVKLGGAWTFVEPRQEAPDFVIESDGVRFGLEVTFCFSGPVSKAGSKLRRSETANAKWLKGIRSEWEAENEEPVALRYHGVRSAAAHDEIITALRSDEFRKWRSMEPFRATICGDGRLYLFWADHSSWSFGDDRTGETANGDEAFQRAIDDKAAKLATYRLAAPTTRLLVVADTPYNSGKLFLTPGLVPDLRGFEEVYFFAYPQEIIPFNGRCSMGSPTCRQ